MILLSMIEKELKQFFRNKGSVIMLFIFPMALITCLSFSLKSFMGGNLDIFSDKKVLYTIENKSRYEDGFSALRKGFEEDTGLVFEEVINKEEAKTLVDEDEAIALVTINENGYDYYRSKEGEGVRSKIFRGIVEQGLSTYALVDTAIEENHKLVEEILKTEKVEYVNESPVGVKEVTSFEYYTFAELALIMMYISVTVAESVYSEGDLKTINRIRLSKVSDLQLIIAKGALGVIIGILQVMEVYLFSTIILKINWGENIPAMISVLLSLAIFSSVLGIITGLLVKESKSINSVLQVIIITVCFLGGCYGPLSMLKSMPIIADIIKFSPIYWVNSALISLNTGIVNNYSMIAIGTCLGAAVLLILGYMTVKKVKGGEYIA